ncbi:MAG TPA: DinB family protein [Vicinamibacterales bacterium]|nr:DinB family protein [Vicinamibacterales bacterium]
MTTGREDLPSELRHLMDAIDACERDAEALVAGMSDEEINWQEKPGETWSVAECIDHLTVINPFYLRGFIPLVETARQQRTGPFRGLSSSTAGRWFVRVLEPPMKTKTKARPEMRPRSNLRREGLVEAFKKSHDSYRALVQQCAEVDVNRVKGPNPFFRFIPMRISTVLQIIPAHDRRHLWQAKNVKDALRAAPPRLRRTQSDS